ncbi:MAG: M56 family metallopeptidase [Bacteroidia bacterium]|nr:M56 family metallopeptidase [Bacteroidia bacterium]
MPYNDVFNPIMESLGWAIFHSLWLGVVTAVLLFIILNFLQKRSPLIRYYVSVMMGLLFFLSVGFVFVKEYREQPAPSIEVYDGTYSGITDAAPLKISEESFFGNLLYQSKQIWERNIRVVVLLWFMGALIFAGRMAAGYAGLIRLSTQDISSPPQEWIQRLRLLAKESGINRPVRLCISRLIDGPVTLWFFRPLILLPTGMLTGMSPAHIEAILLHELAHIHRADFLVNLFQTFIETVLFYHPALWWISGQIRQFREECCDDRVLATGRDVHIYAEALTQVYTFNLTIKPRLIMSATGKNGSFTVRIQRLFGLNPTSSKAGKNLLSLVILLTCFASFAFQVPPQLKTITAAIPELPSVSYFTEQIPTPLISPTPTNANISSTPISQPQYTAEEFRVAIHSGMTKDDLAALKAELKAKEIDLVINEEEYGSNGKLIKVVGKIRFPDGTSGNFSGHGSNMKIEISRQYENGKGGNLHVWAGSSAGNSAVLAPAVPAPPAPPSAVAGVPGTPTVAAPPAPPSAVAGVPGTPTVAGAPAAVAVVPTPPNPPVPAISPEPNVDVDVAPKPTPNPQPKPQPTPEPRMEELNVNNVVRIRPETGEAKPLFILNGKKLTDGIEVEKLDPNAIESVSVLKGEKATKKYGDEGLNGVIIIKTKKEKK